MSAAEKPGKTHTTCPYCGVGCGVVAEMGSDGSVTVAGDPAHPANFGRLCSKGSALAETLSLEDRLLHPEIGGREVEWDEALDHVAEKFLDTIGEYGPDSVAFYVSGQLLTEDYYVANKLMKGYIGSANIDTNSRLCMASAVAGHKRAFGADTVPGCYEDLEQADLVVLVGSNLAWCHPVLYQRMLAARKDRPEMKLVVIDPRKTVTADIADIHLPIAPESDIALFNGLLHHLIEAGAADLDYIARNTRGFETLKDAVAAADIATTARSVGVEEDLLARFFAAFAGTEKTVTLFSQGVNQSASGTDKVNAIINCHLATGRIGRPGMGPFSITGQPNAMGGREVGGLANQLAAHMSIESAMDRALVQTFWDSPTIADKQGLKAVDMFDAVADGTVKAIWIMATNPVDSLPNGAAVEMALAKCPFVVVSDVSGKTDTIRQAHVRLPAAGWGEKDGTVTNAERRVSRQRAFLGKPGSCRSDWWIISEVAGRMGWGEAFSYRNAAEIYREHAALSGFRNGGKRDFDISPHALLCDRGYDRMIPYQWPLRSKTEGTARLFGDGAFFTSGGRAQFIETEPGKAVRASEPEQFVLNSGRVRDQWHTMTRTAKSERLSAHIAEPFVEINPLDAARLGVAPASLAVVENERGKIVVRVLVTDRQQPGSIFVPMHWTDQFASNGRVGKLIAPVTDRFSGQPALKSALASVTPFEAKWYGFAVLKQRPRHVAASYWAAARCRSGWRIEFAGDEVLDDPSAFSASLFDWRAAGAEGLAYHDQAQGEYRLAAFDGAELAGAVYVAPNPVAVSRAWLIDRLGTEATEPADRFRVLAGRPGGGLADPGPTICACFDVGANTITGAVRDGCASVEAVGAKLGAGTNCGSCRAEIQVLVDQVLGSSAREAEDVQKAG